MVPGYKNFYNFGKTTVIIQSEDYILEVHAEEAILKIMEDIENGRGTIPYLQNKRYNIEMIGEVQGMVTNISEKPEDEELKRLFQKIKILK